MTPDVAPFRLAFKEILAAVETFNAAWPAHVRHIEVYTIDRATDHELGYKPSAIAVQRVTGAEAVGLAQASFADFHRADGQRNVGVARRLPGLIALDTDPADLVAPVNAAKDHLMALLEQAELPPSTNPVMRHRAYKALLGDVVVQHLARRIHTIGLPLPHQLTFCWMAHSSGVHPVDAIEVEKRIRRYHEDHTASARQDEAIAQDLLQVKCGPTERLVVYKPVAPHPRLQVRQAPASKPAGLPAAMPIFLHWPEDAPFPAFTPLESLDVAGAARASVDEARGPRPRKERVPVLLHLAIFRELVPAKKKTTGEAKQDATAAPAARSGRSNRV